MTLPIKYKIIGLATATALVIVFSISILTFTKKQSVGKHVKIELEELARHNVELLVKDVYNLCETTNDLIQQKINTDLNVARNTFATFGEAEFGDEMVSWDAINQYDKSTSTVSLPKLQAGGTWLGQNSSISSYTPVVDETKKLVGGTCTIFQRMNEQGDMLRVATNVEKLDGTRAIGTFIPANNPDGSPNTVLSTVLAGKTYKGRAYVVNDWYLTAYEPLYKDGQIIGMLYVGVKQNSATNFRKAIQNTTIGETGYIYILGGKGQQKGHYIISKGGERDGENIWDSKDVDGKYMIQSVVNKALNLKGNNVDFDRYLWQNKGESTARMKIAAIAYFEPWDWVIGTSAYEDEIYRADAIVNAGLSSMNNLIILFGLFLLVVSAVVAYFFGNKIANPLRQTIQSIRNVAENDIPGFTKNLQLTAEGNFNSEYQIHPQTVTVKSNDEIGLVANAVNMMFENLYKASLALEQMKGNIKTVVADINTLVDAAIAGDLQVRADSTKNKGEFNKIIAGINETLDAVINPINAASIILERVSSRDLTKTVEGDYQGDHAKIKDAVNNAIKNLRESLSQVTTGSAQVASAARQIGASSQTVAQGASEQASSLEEVSSSLEELSALTKRNASNATEAKEITDDAQVTVQEGKVSMDQLSNAMDKIKVSSDETSKIIKTIDEIAFQTNLLALNAAVEAARAGEAGKGFAVVAEEVRNLAIRSAEAAKDTAEMIVDAVNNAEEGVSLNQQVIANLEVINNKVNNVSEVMTEIAQSSVQQTQGIDQINTAVGQMNHVTQQNAANSEESAGASEELSGQAEEMQSMVQKFKVNDNDVVSTSESARTLNTSSTETAFRHDSANGNGHDENAKLEFDHEILNNF